MLFLNRMFIHIHLEFIYIFSNNKKIITCRISPILITALLIALIQLPINQANGDELPNIIVGPNTLIALAGQNVTFSCATAPNNDSQLMVSWQRNGQSISFSRHRQTLLHIPENGSLSTLHLDHVSELDEGFYQCTARNEIGLDVSRPARLTVQYGAKITGGQRFVYNVTTGTNVPIECNARGQPPPKIELFIGNISLLDEEKPHFFNVFLQYNATNATNITCRASNFLTPVNETVEDTRIYEIYVQQIEEPTAEIESIERDSEEQEKKSHTPNGYCAPYIGQVCRSNVPRNSLVFYNLSDADDFANNVNEEIVSNLWDELISSLQEPCRSAAEKLLCYYSFPQCQWSKGFPQSKPLCREDCLAVRESFCNREWALLEDNRQRGVYFKSRGHFRLPDCDQLPSHNNHTDSDQCSHADLTTIHKDKVTYDCIRGRGRFYQGTVNVTKNGLPCQAWDLQYPHAHNRPPMVFPEIWNSKNYCRNAGGEEPMPWCYTQDLLVRWQHCDIPVCESETLKNITKPLVRKTNTILDYNNLIDLIRRPLSSVVQPEHPLALPLGAALLALIIITICVFIAFSVRQVCRKRKLYSQTMSSIDGVPIDVDLSKLPSNCTYHCTAAILNPKLESLEYHRNKIIYIRDIGCGAFGRVFMAKAPGLIEGEEFTVVAVKVLREEAGDDLQTDFEREASLMAEFDHPNVVKLLGVCALGKPMCLLVEYMSRGDLNSFLRTLGPANYVVRLPHEDAFVDHPKKLTDSDMVNIARQIASGMTYLSELNFVHRDLASRNCLINEQIVVKISDFGLSQRVTSNSNYYRSDIEKDAVPIRWMPPEAILYGRFTTASDIWAFGVLMWEIFSYALQPYYGLSHEQVINYLKDGHLLQTPEKCPAEVYALMRSCWQIDPTARPLFRAMESSLEDLYGNLLAKEEETESARQTNESTASISNMSNLDG